MNMLIQERGDRMAAFLEDINPFYGTRQKNEQNQDLEKFLEVYDPKMYENSCVTTDVLVIQHKTDFKSVETGLKLLMIKRKNHPCIGYWALPGGFVEVKEDLEAAAKRELEEETHLTGISLEQLATWGEYKRDPRARIITVSYLALVEDNLNVEAGDDAAEAIWMDILLKKGDIEQFIEDKKKKVKTKYKLELINEEEGIHLSSEVYEIKNQEGLLREKNYQIGLSEQIACDHARIILHALLFIEHLLLQ